MERDLEARLLKLERRNRLLLVLLLGAVAAVFLAGAAAKQDAKVLRTERLEIVDADGTVRTVLGADEEGSSGLFLNDSEGGLRISLTHDPEQSALFIRDETETVRIGVSQFAHGGGGVALHGPESKGAAVLYYKTEGSLAIYEADGSVSARVPRKKQP